MSEEDEKLKALIKAVVKEALGDAPKQEQAQKQPFWLVIIGQVTNPGIVLSIVGLAATAALGFGLYYSGGHLLDSLQHTEIARGLITFLIATATVLIAVITVLYAVLSADSTPVNERFPFAKEVLTLLIGILGTILGFYFGSAEKSGKSLDLGDIQITSQQAFTRVSGRQPALQVQRHLQRRRLHRLPGRDGRRMDHPAPAEGPEGW